MFIKIFHTSVSAYPIAIDYLPCSCGLYILIKHDFRVFPCGSYLCGRDPLGFVPVKPLLPNCYLPSELQLLLLAAWPQWRGHFPLGCCRCQLPTVATELWLLSFDNFGVFLVVSFWLFIWILILISSCVSNKGPNFIDKMSQNQHESLLLRWWTILKTKMYVLCKIFGRCVDFIIEFISWRCFGHYIPFAIYSPSHHKEHYWPTFALPWYHKFYSGARCTCIAC